MSKQMFCSISNWEQCYIFIVAVTVYHVSCAILAITAANSLGLLAQLKIIEKEEKRITKFKYSKSGCQKGYLDAKNNSKQLLK